MQQIVCPTLFGMEALAAREMEDLGYPKEAIRIDNGQVRLDIPSAALAETVARLNFWLRTAERVLIRMAEFPAQDFDQFFDGAEMQLWSEWIPEGAAFTITGYSRKSKLYGVPACQRLMKKAAVNAMLRGQGRHQGQLEEDPKKGQYRFQFAIVEDQCTIFLDSTGHGLHKRGYRPLQHAAPLRETVAAAMLKLSFFERNLAHGEHLYDAFCGSGTLAIEAALMASNTAPGLKRHFSAQRIPWIGKPAFDRERERAKLEVKEAPSAPFLFGGDIDPGAVAIAQKNAKAAGVADWVRFERQDAKGLSPERLEAITGSKRVLVLANPPYGERLMDEGEAAALVRAFGRKLRDEEGLLPGLRLTLLSANAKIERQLGVTADKKRKLYNGALPCKLYQYFKLRRSEQ